MINSSKEVESPTNQDITSANDGKLAKATSSSAPWLGLKDPRIVRVSKASGGKDRHSKVCTIRGLRDRRVRLSVLTAIQLYDLQDRLGLNQPSKVIDWLLDAAKHEIDELPPLPLPPANFGPHHPAVTSPHEVDHSSQSDKERSKVTNSINWEDAGELERSNFWSSDSLMREKSKEVVKDLADENESWTKGNEQDEQERDEGPGASTSFLLRPTHSSSLGFAPYASFSQLEPPSFQLGGHGYATQTEDLHNLNVVPLQSTLSLSSGSQILLSRPETTQSYFASNVRTAADVDPRQVNHFQMSTPSSQNLLLNPTAASPYPMSKSMRSFSFQCDCDP
ncbi:hypothetical protein K2173_025853 [Erythroxylum novogranatense]|uniref:TCP domain-containing protein n=1 Tax=Erythroxylum novogranatense TaxID=1862640 RepID=A0AAV8SHW1_9ROSI|nr:hypothetical protein K2173_025853 [Erythroxylum novogranatense]